MTVSTVPYYEWNQRNDSLSAPFNACSPNLVSLQSYYRRRWGSSNLGCHVQRVIGGSSSLSSHAWGAATDDRFPSRAVTVEVMAFLIASSAELGINTIHDYTLQRKWDPLVGWHSASIGSVGGDWIHVETTPAKFGDGRPVEDKLTGSETDVALTGDDAKLVAAVNWETILEYGGAKAPARVWLTEARELANRAWIQSQANANAIAALEAKVDALQVPAADVVVIRKIVRDELDATQWQSRPPS